MKINFFINGFPENKDNGYNMIFYLDQSDDGDVADNYIEIEGNRYSLERIRGVQKLSVPFTDPTKRYAYSVFEKGVFKYGGSFIAKPTDPKICCVSCNASLDVKVPCWAQYGTYDGYKDGNWKLIHDESPELIIHMGDQIYADGVFKSGKDIEKRIRFLYIHTYANQWQGVSMRNSLNMMIADDHEALDGFGNPEKKINSANEKYSEYIETAVNMYVKYQPTLATPEFGSFNFQYGGYEIICIDMRLDYNKFGHVMSDRILEFTENVLSTTSQNDVIMILPRPLIIISKEMAELIKKRTEYADMLMSPGNQERTKRFIDLMDQYDKNYTVVCGDSHLGLKMDIRLKNKTITQYITSGITVKPTDRMVPFWRQRVEKNLRSLPNDYDVANIDLVTLGNNYGILQNGVFNIKAI